MINIAICDDENYMLHDVRKLTYEFFISNNIDINIKLFKDGSDLLNDNEKFDIIFLDIQMKDTDGMTAAKLLREKGFTGSIVFITVMKDCVFESFEVQPFAYLIKPIKKDEFFAVMKRLFKVIKSSETAKLYIKKRNESIIIDFDEILYCEVINRKAYIHLINGKVIDYYEKMADLEKKLNKNFFKCHRSYIINLKYLNSFNKETAFIYNNNVVPVSRLRVKDLSLAVFNYMEEE